MSLHREVTRDVKLQEKRRGVRMNSRVPVALEWVGENGKNCREKAHTRIVSPYGCLLVLPHNLQLELEVLLTNLATRQTNHALIVWKGNERSEGWEIGIELIEPEMNFWGLDL